MRGPWINETEPAPMPDDQQVWVHSSWENDVCLGQWWSLSEDGPWHPTVGERIPMLAPRWEPDPDCVRIRDGSIYEISIRDGDEGQTVAQICGYAQVDGADTHDAWRIVTVDHDGPANGRREA